MPYQHSLGFFPVVILSILASLFASSQAPCIPMATNDGLTPAQRETLLDLGIAAIVLKAQKVRHGALPEHASFVTMRKFAAGLERTYADRLPRLDGWGRDLLVAATHDSYVVVSPGEDGLMDEEIRTVTPDVDASI